MTRPIESVTQPRLERPKLGARVRFAAVLERKKEFDGKVTWEEHPASGEGVYAGFRVVYEGDHVRGSNGSYEYDPEPGYLRVNRGVSHALVVFNERTKPFRVPWSGLELIDKRRAKRGRI